MPCGARLDARGLLQHVMARGIETRNMFRDEEEIGINTYVLVLLLQVETNVEEIPREDLTMRCERFLASAVLLGLVLLSGTSG